MTERCINLTAAEAKAWAAGATVLIRPAHARWNPEKHPNEYAVRWKPGDVLILREKWDIADINEQEVMIRYWCGGHGWVVTLPTPHGWRPLLANYEWVRSPATMPKALARHRRRVVSARVCRAMDLAESEWRAAGFSSWEDACGGTTNIGKGWVSVTTTENER